MRSFMMLMRNYWARGVFSSLGWWCLGGLLMWLGPAYWLWFTAGLLLLCVALTFYAWWWLRKLDKALDQLEERLR